MSWDEIDMDRALRRMVEASYNVNDALMAEEHQLEEIGRAAHQLLVAAREVGDLIDPDAGWPQIQR